MSLLASPGAQAWTVTLKTRADVDLLTVNGGRLTGENKLAEVTRDVRGVVPYARPVPGLIEGTCLNCFMPRPKYGRCKCLGVRVADDRCNALCFRSKARV